MECLVIPNCDNETRLFPKNLSDYVAIGSSNLKQIFLRAFGFLWPCIAHPIFMWGNQNYRLFWKKVEKFYIFIFQVINKGLVSYRDPESAPGRGQKTLNVTRDMDLTKVNHLNECYDVIKVQACKLWLFFLSGRYSFIRMGKIKLAN